jgi:hypothetical protein
VRPFTVVVVGLPFAVNVRAFILLSFHVLILVPLLNDNVFRSAASNHN